MWICKFAFFWSLLILPHITVVVDILTRSLSTLIYLLQYFTTNSFPLEGDFLSILVNIKSLYLKCIILPPARLSEVIVAGLFPGLGKRVSYVEVISFPLGATFSTQFSADLKLINGSLVVSLKNMSPNSFLFFFFEGFA